MGVVHDGERLEREGKITLENILPPEFVVDYIVPPEFLKPPEGWEDFEFPPMEKLPYLVPPWLDPEENHWAPPENKPFWTREMDNILPGSEIDIWIPENQLPQINLGGGDWVSAEDIVENVLVGGIRIYTENFQIPEGVLNNVVTTVYNLDNMPANIPVPPGEDYCEFFQVGTNIPEYIENAEVGFKVDKDWIAANNLDKDTITLEHWVDGVWMDLPTKIKGEDENYLYCSAQAPSFSVFAVTGESIGAVTEVTPPAAAEISTVAIAAIGVGVLVAALVVIVWLRRRK